MFDSCLKKQQWIKEYFASCKTEEAKYHAIIELGRQQHRLNPAFKIPKNIVQGCQSVMYLYSHLEDGLVIFEADSDALISFGLASLLLKVYSGETPETILKCPPKYLEELGILTSLTPSRSNGLQSIYLKMKQEALRLLLEK